MEHPNTSRGDVTYWQLSHTQAARYHARLSTMHAERAVRFADRAIAEARKAEIGCWISFALIAVVLVLRIVAMVIE